MTMTVFIEFTLFPDFLLITKTQASAAYAHRSHQNTFVWGRNTMLCECVPCTVWAQLGWQPEAEAEGSQSVITQLAASGFLQQLMTLGGTACIATYIP